MDLSGAAMDHRVAQKKFDYRGSVVTVEIARLADPLSIGADVHTRDGRLICRLVLTAGEANCACLEVLVEKLAVKAKKFVDESQGDDG